jgi:hypothetical protein
VFALDRPDKQAPWFVFRFGGNLQQIRIVPKQLRLLEINTVLGQIARTFSSVRERLTWVCGCG